MKLIKRKDGKTPFLRATPEEEIRGLDLTEHGLVTAYAGFQMAPQSFDYGDAVKEVNGDIPPSEAIEVETMPNVDNIKPGDKTITKIEIIFNIMQ